MKIELMGAGGIIVKKFEDGKLTMLSNRIHVPTNMNRYEIN